MFRLSGYAPEPADAEVDIEKLSPARRARRALGGFAGMLGAAVLSVFIPIAHFVLVPSLFIGAFVMGALRFRHKSLVVKAHGRCPDCGAEQDLDILGPFPGRTDLFCRSCHRGIKLLPPAQAA